MNLRNHSTWNLFLRYQAQAERLYRRAIEEFERLRALRTTLPEEVPFVEEEGSKDEAPLAEEVLVKEGAPSDVPETGEIRAEQNLPNEPISSAQPQPNPTTSAP